MILQNFENYSPNEAVSHSSWTAWPWKWRHYFIWNTGKYTPINTEWHPRWLESLAESQTLHSNFMLVIHSLLIFWLLHKNDHKGHNENKASYYLSENIFTVIIKFTCIRGTYFTKL
jgi:hypothetical protein